MQERDGGRFYYAVARAPVKGKASVLVDEFVKYAHPRIVPGDYFPPSVNVATGDQGPGIPSHPTALRRASQGRPFGIPLTTSSRDVPS